MTQPTNTFDTYDSVGNREDLSDLISTLETDETPVLSSIGKTKATAKYHEWQTDAYGAAASNAQVEGDAFTAAAITPTVRIGNRSQIMTKVFTITDTQEAISKAGRQKEAAYQKVMHAARIKQDMEKAITGVGVAVTGDATTAATLAGMESWITTNVSLGSGGAVASLTSNVPTTAPTDGTQRAYTEDLLKVVLQGIYDNGGRPDLISVGSFNKFAMNNFGSATRNTDVNKRSAVSGVDVYMDDFGNTMKVVPNRHARTRTALVLDTEKWAVATLRGLTSGELAKTSDGQGYYMVTEFTLESKNQKASGKVADLTTS